MISPMHAARSLVLALLASAAMSAADAAGDGMEARVAACIACHGRDGQAANSAYFPRLAGKPAAYLYEQLRGFRDGRRHQAEMDYLLTHLGDAYLREMADYFAALDLPYPAPAPPSLSAAEAARGRALVFHGDPGRGIPACAACHGEALTGAGSAIPGLLGLPRLYIASQLGAWVTGDRRALAPDCMAEVGRKLGGEDIRAIAGWLAAQPLPAAARPAAPMPDRLPLACRQPEAHG